LIIMIITKFRLTDIFLQRLFVLQHRKFLVLIQVNT